MYVIQTDLPCRVCKDEHGVVTNMCDVIVFADEQTAEMVAAEIDGSKVVEVLSVPRDVSVKWDMRIKGKPNPAFPVGMNSI